MILFKYVIGSIYMTMACPYGHRLVKFNKKAKLENPKNHYIWYTGKKNKNLEYDIYQGWKKLVNENWPKQVTVAYG